jgi:hypothetical protein
LNRHDAKTPRWEWSFHLGVMAVQFILSRKFWQTRGARPAIFPIAQKPAIEHYFDGFIDLNAGASDG